MAPLLNESRDIIAPDYPGYGGSDFHSAAPDIADYAAAVSEAAQAIAPGAPVDALGFHTGCLVAAEMRLRKPALARRIVLIDIPYFHREQRKQMLQKMSKTVLRGELDCLSAAWDFNIGSRLHTMPLQRAFALFVEQLRSGENSHCGYHAAFTYACEEKFARLNGDCLVVATRSDLRDATLQAHNAIADSRLVELPHIGNPALETGAADIARAANEFLAR